MSTSVSGLSTNFFPSPQNGFTTTTAGSVASGATTVTLNSVAGYSNGQVATLIVDPSDASKKQTFTGVVDTAGVQLTSVKWTAGTNQTHALGATIVDYATATHIGQMSKGILIEHNQSGNHTAITGTSAVFTGNVTAANFVQSGGAAANGWTTGLTVPNTVTALGNRSYSLVVNSTDLTGTVSAGMRLRTTRTVAAPTQCTSLNGTTQYYSKSSPAGMTFTDDFVVSAWIKLTAYSSGVNQMIASRYNLTSGWEFYVNTAGQLVLIGHNAGAGNYSAVTSYQSIPLNKWVHVSAQLDMSTFTATTTTSYTMMDGVDVPAFVTRGGTNPIQLVQAGNLEIGSSGGGAAPFTGKIAQVAIYSAKVTQATILASMNQGLAGTETSLISAYSFNNSINDLNANANNLTANGSAVATNADSPFGGQADGTISSTLDYAEIVSASFSTNTTLVVRTSEVNTIPTSGGVSAVSYSTQAYPYNCPRIDNILGRAIFAGGTFSNASATATNILGLQVPVTIPANRKVRIIASTENLYNATLANGQALLSIWDGTAGSGTQLAQSFQQGATTDSSGGYCDVIVMPSSTSKTYNAGLARGSGGTASFDSGITTPAFLTVELL